MGRAPCCDKDAVKRGAWTPEEDKILAEYISKHGHGTWRSLPNLAGLLRCGKSCRLRWTNYLRPDIKRGPFTPEEQSRIIQLHRMLGNKWAAIASHLEGRTDNEVKNFWNSQLKKRFFCTGHNLQASRPPSCSNSINTKPESASTRHMVQWESARVEAEARLSMNSFLNPSSSTPKTDSDYFLRLWNSEVGESFRKVNEQDGRESRSTTSHTSSLTKVGSGSGVTTQAGPSWTSSATEQKFMEYDSSRKDANDMMVGSDSSDSYELDDPADRALKQLLDFPSDDDMGFIQGQTDDVSIFFRH